MPRPSEDELISHYLAPLAGPLGLGLRDDAALASPPPGHDLVLTKDMLVAGRHFFANDPPDAIARKALRVNLSDLAAKGAEPTGFLLGLSLPDDWTEPWLAAFVSGLAADARTYGCPLLGGDTVSMPAGARSGPLTLSITALGTVPAGRMVPRTGARDGDRIYVSGTIGDAVLGLLVRWDRAEDRAWIAGLEPSQHDALVARHLRPEPRIALRGALHDHARCAMDVSDGMLGDLAKMLRLEGLGAVIAAPDVPMSRAATAAVVAEPRLLAEALCGGDDYEIVCCVAPDRAEGFEAAAGEAGVRVTAVGTAESALKTVELRDAVGRQVATERQSFLHF